ncbi:GBS Bsp-like repeat-containing protein [Eubacterium sp. MSJ-21]|nr:GBS Bsp-like repeat-containing protein [Eubacterium sp. MSJ-21]
MKKLRRIMAWLVCICMVFAGGSYTPRAAEPDSTYEMQTDTATGSDAASVMTQEADVETPVEEQQGVLNYIYVDNPAIRTPDTQKVLVGLGDGTNAIESAVLSYTNTTTGAGCQAEAEYLDNESALFSMEFASADQAGAYTLTGITYTIGGVSYNVNLSDAGVNACFGVDCDVTTNPDGVVSDAENDADMDGVVITDAEGNVISNDDFEEAAVAASDGSVKRDASGNMVVVLDPGHGSEGDTGAVSTWNNVTYIERDINLKIAQYCKAVLDQYKGITVYMTRTDNSGGLKVGAADGEQFGTIVKYAQSVNADILVSIHNNSAAASAHGAEVYYPNSSYNSFIGQMGQGLSETVMAKLKALGLAERGAKIRNSEDGNTYPDGSLADYYGVIRQSKLAGFPGIIIEHAFLTNQSDATNFLGSDEALQKLGQADAQAIIDYFGISNDDDLYKDGDASIRVVQNGATSTYIMVASGVPNAPGLLFRVKNESTGEMKEYDALPGDGDGCWYASFDVNEFSAAGKFTITACAKRNMIACYPVGTTTLSVEAPKPAEPVNPSVSAFDADGQNTFILIADNLENADQITGVKFGVWNEGLSDLHWYEASKDSLGRWLSLMGVADYKKSGTYYTDAYATYSNGAQAKIGSATFEVANASTEGIVVENVNANKGSFDIVIRGVKSPSGVAGVRVPVWTAADLSDLHWYDAEKQEDGSYVVHANIENHKYNYGVYAMQSYVTGRNGVENVTYSYCYNLAQPEAKVSSFNADPDRNFILIAEDIPGGSRVTGVKFGVWKDGLSDLHWYEASKDSLGRWLSVVGVADYMKFGTYYSDAYATTSDGRTYKIGSTIFDVTTPTAQIQVQNVNDDAGTYDVLIKNIVSPSGVNAVRVPVWTASDLSDIHWYTAQKQSDNTYKVTVNVENHQGHYGVYAIQAYIDAGNGMSAGAASLCYRFMPESALYQISGATGTSVAQMTAYYNAHATYPEFYQNSDAPTISDFCQLYIEECAAEGIKAEVAFCQAMKETGFLKYGGAVKIEQYNFAGIGATDNGGTPATFGSVREGIRAQVQHLKAYADTSELANTCVDPRFSLVTRGTAKYVEWLGIKENPNGKGWASDAGYGYSLRQDYIDKLFEQ